MASDYGLMTVAELEQLLGGRDLETMDSDYTDTLVEQAIISRAEKKVCGLAGTTYTSSTITVPVGAALEDFAVFYAESLMIRDGHMEKDEKTVSTSDLKIHTDNMKALFEDARDQTRQSHGFYVIKEAQNNEI